MNVAIACGGTGGHLFPGIAVGEALRAQGHAVLLLVSEKSVDATAVRDHPEFAVERIPAVGLPRALSPAMARFFTKGVEGLLRCRRVYARFRPDAVLGMGGFTSTAPILAGRFGGLPTFVHESNAIPGKANRLNAALADRVLLGFAECRRYFPAGKTDVTGTPLRSGLRAPVDRAAALARLLLKEGHRTVLVMGGSQGAQGLNRAVTELLPRFARASVQFVHLTGVEDQDRVRERYEREGIPAFVGAFYHRMEDLYGVADLAVARAGAASLTELAAFGIPSILVPYPYAAENHQLLNAEIFAREGAAEVIQEARVGGDALGSLIEQLLADDLRREKMSVRMRALASSGSAERIASLIENFRK